MHDISNVINTCVDGRKSMEGGNRQSRANQMYTAIRVGFNSMGCKLEDLVREVTGYPHLEEKIPVAKDESTPISLGNLLVGGPDMIWKKVEGINKLIDELREVLI